MAQALPISDLALEQRTMTDVRPANTACENLDNDLALFRVLPGLNVSFEISVLLLESPYDILRRVLRHDQNQRI